MYLSKMFTDGLEVLGFIEKYRDLLENLNFLSPKGGILHLGEV
jgi:hypothetical protein